MGGYIVPVGKKKYSVSHCHCTEYQEHECDCNSKVVIFSPQAFQKSTDTSSPLRLLYLTSPQLVHTERGEKERLGKRK